MKQLSLFFLLSFLVVVAMAGCPASASGWIGYRYVPGGGVDYDVKQTYDNTPPLTTADIDAKVADLISHGKFEEALSFVNEILLNHPTDPRAYYNKGMVLYNLGRYEEAIEVLDWGIMIDPSDKDARYRDLAESKLNK